MLSTTREILVSKRTLWLYTTMGVVLVSFNILLVAQNKGLKAYATRIERSLELQPGTPLPSVEGLGLRGEGIKLDYGVDPRKTLLLVFSNSCKACTDNMPNWEAVVKNIDQRAFRVAAISLWPQGVKEYLGRHQLGSIPVLAELDPKSRVAYNLMVTPQTILINSQGVAERVWTGMITDKEKREVEEALGVRLPGPQ